MGTTKNASIVNHHERTFTVTVKEKASAVYIACLGDDPMSDKRYIARNWGQKRFWGEKAWCNIRDKTVLWKNVLDAFKNDSRYEKERNYTVDFQHVLLPGRCKELGLDAEGEEARMRKLDAEWVEWAKAHGYSLPARDDTNHRQANPVDREEVGVEQISAPSDKSHSIFPPIADAEILINRIRSVNGQPERNMEDVVKELLVRLGHPINRIVFQRGRVDLILQDTSGKPAFVFEVKRSIASESERSQARRQAMDYACQTGAQFLVITDADRYEIYDRHRGLDFASMYCGRFQLTQFYAANEAVLDLLRLSAE